MQAETLQAVALAVAAERSVDAVLRRIVDGLVEQSGVALARVWLIDRGDVCGTCRLRTDCDDRSRCLHLSASAGSPLDRREDWSRLEGAFRRFPLGIRKIGRIGASGHGIFLADVTRDDEWIVHPEWIGRERIRSFGGQPLIFRGEVLGVLGVFSREPGDPHTFAWLRTLADHAAVAIAHARALAEIERLKERLELENDLPARGGARKHAAGGSSAPVRPFARCSTSWRSSRRRPPRC